MCESVGRPKVRVPVLSNAITFVRAICWNTCADFMRIPICAPLPVATMSAVGTASPNTHGHDMTRTVTAIEKANSADAPAHNHAQPESKESATIDGTKYALTASTSLVTGTLDAAVFSTNEIICARVVCSPTRSARNLRNPVLTKDAEMTESPRPFSTGILSPVTFDSSSVACPDVMIPSTGTSSPAFTSTVSPTSTSCAGIYISISWVSWADAALAVVGEEGDAPRGTDT